MSSRTVAAIVVVMSLALMGQQPIAAPQVGPLDLSGVLNGAPYRIRVPAAWNGTLLVWAHGYRDKADHPGEVDNRSVELAPNAALELALLERGYALAGSAFRDNGWVIAEGLQDTKDLVEFFRDTIALPDHTILESASFSTLIAYESMTKFGGLYDGAIAACGAGAGATRTWDSTADLLIAYDTVLGVPPAWGTPADVRDDLDFDTEVFAKLGPELSNPVNFPKFEFIRLVVGIPGRGLTPPPPPAFFPGWAVTDMFFATEGRAELERRARGPVVETVGHVYDLDASEVAYLVGLGVPSAVVSGWLATMNAQAPIVAPFSSRNYLERNVDFNGNFNDPVLSIHTVIDPLLPVSHEAALLETVRSNRQDNLFQTYTTGVGHCNFTGPQLLTALDAMDTWVRTGVRPVAAQFPAALGFAPNFLPPPFPQP
jgi:hypothetical protein